jgi:hypothetical protein
VPIIDNPFQRIAVDLVGQITPVSEKENRYILLVVDYASRCPEAFALPRKETENIVEAWFDIFARVGFRRKYLVIEVVSSHHN